MATISGGWTGPGEGVTLVIDATVNVGQEWTLTGPEGFVESDMHDAIFTDLPSGDYTVAWSTVADYDPPSPASEGPITVNPSDLYVFTSPTYTPSAVTGDVTVTPTEAGATWTVTGLLGYDSGTQTGTQTLYGLAYDTYTAIFDDNLHGFTVPTHDTDVLDSATLDLTGNYVARTPATITVNAKNDGSDTLGTLAANWAVNAVDTGFSFTEIGSADGTLTGPVYVGREYSCGMVQEFGYTFTEPANITGSGEFICDWIPVVTDACAAFVPDYTFSIDGNWGPTLSLNPATTTAIADFYMRPSEANQNTLIGFSENNDISSYSDCVMLIRFNAEGDVPSGETGWIDVRNGAEYCGDAGAATPCEAAVPYVPDHWYHFYVTVDVIAETYTVQVEDCDDGLVTVHTNASFRSDAPLPRDSVGYWSVRNQGSGTDIYGLDWQAAGAVTETLSVDMTGAPAGASWSLSPDPGGGHGSGTASDLLFDAPVAEYTLTWGDTSFAYTPPTPLVHNLVEGVPHVFDLTSNYVARTGRTSNFTVDVEKNGVDDPGWGAWEVRRDFDDAVFDSGNGDATVAGTAYDGRDYTCRFTGETGYSDPPTVTRTASASSQEFYGNYVTTAPPETRDLDVNGWTVLDPASAGNVYYVSSSEGSPGGTGTYGDPFDSIADGISASSNNTSDWILVKRGDTFNESGLQAYNGISFRQPWVLAAYGSGADLAARIANVTDPRPIIQTPNSAPGIGNRNLDLYHCVIMGMDFYSYTRDPGNPSYSGDSSGPEGINFLWKSEQSGGVFGDCLIEDCRIRWYASGIRMETGQPANNEWFEGMHVRRNVIHNNHRPNNKVQGHWLNQTGLGSLIEDNFYDTNGWNLVNHSVVFSNHNIYASDLQNTTFKNNILCRGSSIGMKMTSYPPETGAKVHDLTFDGNVYIDNETAIGLGGNDEGGFPRYSPVGVLRFEDCVIKNNLVMKAGMTSRGGGRNVGAGFDVKDHINLVCQDNIMCDGKYRGAGELGHALRLQESWNGGTFSGNIIHNFPNGQMNCILVDDDSPADGVTGLVFTNNICKDNGTATMCEDRRGADQWTWTNNRWWSEDDQGTSAMFDTEGTSRDFASWATFTGDTGAEEEVGFVSDTRTMEGYMASIGEVPTMAKFYELSRLQRKGNWRDDLTSIEIRAWFNEGFTEV